MAIYDPKSRVAEEFINDQEIRDTLAYAEEHKSDVPLLMSILDKAAQFKGLTHREAAVLLACDVKEVNDRIFETAIKVKEHIYGSRIVLFAPLYLSNYCVNTCTYCPYHAKNKSIVRKKLTQEEIRNEVIASATSACSLRRASTPSTIRSSTSSSPSRPSTRSSTRTAPSAAST